MKKLVMVIAAIAMVAGVQAATVSWSGAMGQMSAKEADATKYTAILIDSSSYALNTAIADLAAGSFNYTNAAVLATTAGIAQGTNFRFSQSNVAQAEGSKPYVAGDLVNAYAIIFNGAPDAGSEAMITVAKNATVASTGLATFAFGSLSTASNISATWSAVNVPEPTSGLLLLLGMAGLALRRKQA